MPIAATDIVVYGSAVMPDDDSVTQIGGSLDATRRPVFADIVANDQVEVFSSDAGDTTQTVTITGRTAAGVLISDPIALNGVAVVLSALTFERILKIVVSAAHAGTITVRSQDSDTLIAAMEEGISLPLIVLPPVLEIRRVFYDALAEPAGGVQRKYYEKVFFLNRHATLSLTNAQIAEQPEPGGLVAFALEAALNGNDTNGVGNNRQVAPGGYVFDSAIKNVANGGNHIPAGRQGVWLELTLPAGTAPTKTTYTLRESGQTT